LAVDVVSFSLERLPIGACARKIWVYRGCWMWFMGERRFPGWLMNMWIDGFLSLYCRFGLGRRGMGWEDINILYRYVGNLCGDTDGVQ
jgi:hypothetical protein